MRKGVTIGGEDIKAHTKKKQEADSSEEEPSGDGDSGHKKHGAGKNDRGDGKSGKTGAKKWFVGCYRYGGDYRLTTCHAVGPIG